MARITTFCSSISQCFRQLSLKAISLIFLSVVMLGLALVSLPVILDQPLIQKKLAVALSDWSGGNLSFDGKIALEYFPHLSLTAEHVFLKDIRRLPNLNKMRARSVTATFRWWPLLIGNLDVGELKLEKPEIYVVAKFKGAHTPEEQLKNILKTIQNIPFTTVVCNDALLVVPNNKKNGRDLLRFTANISREDDRGNISGRGSVIWHGREVFISGYTAVTAESLANDALPISLKIGNELFQSQFSGTVVTQNDYSFHGQASFKEIKFLELSDWAGVPLKWEGVPVKTAISGDLQWQDQQMNFQNAHLSFGSLSAEGKVSFNYETSKPVIEGSLSFAALQLDSQEHKSLFNALFSLKKNRTKKQIALSDYVDIDLRLFSERVHYSDVTGYSVGATLLVNDNQVKVQIAEAKAFGGDVYGQFLARIGQKQYKTSANLAFKNIKPERLSAFVIGNTLFEGRADLQLDISSRGYDKDSFLKNLEGTIHAESKTQGTISLDVPHIFNASYGYERMAVTKVALKKKWQSILKGKTQFSALSALLTIKNGLLQCNRVQVQENGYLLSIHGRTDLVNRQVRWLFDRRLVDDGSSMRTPGYGIAAVRRVVTLVEGWLEMPRIRHRYVGVHSNSVEMGIFGNPENQNVQHSMGGGALIPIRSQ